LLREVLTIRRWTELDCAEWLGVAQSTVHRWVSSKSRPGAAERYVLQRRLRVPWRSWDAPATRPSQDEGLPAVQSAFPES
jgi:transcriptional regulator with XRE-family HTH domain